MARVTGIGGIFFKCSDAKGVSDWYRDVFGFTVEDWGGALLRPDPLAPPHVVWSPFEADTKYFAPSDQPFMINFAVDDLNGIIETLNGKGVKILGRDTMDGIGEFAWLLDPAGTKIELWEPKR